PNPRGWVVEEKLPFEALMVDYAVLGRQAELDRKRLKRVVFYAAGKKCRTPAILGYFGSREARQGGFCGHCDNCGGIPARASQPTPKLPSVPTRGAQRTRARQSGRALPCVEPPRTVVRKILSCVVRLEKHASVTTLVGVMCGSQARKISRRKLDKLSTWRLLAYLKQSDARRVVDATIRHGLLDQVGSILMLTDAGQRIMLDAHAEMPPDLATELQTLFPEPPRSTHPWRPQSN